MASDFLVWIQTRAAWFPISVTSIGMSARELLLMLLLRLLLLEYLIINQPNKFFTVCNEEKRKDTYKTKLYIYFVWWLSFFMHTVVVLQPTTTKNQLSHKFCISCMINIEYFFINFPHRRNMEKEYWYELGQHKKINEI